MSAYKMETWLKRGYSEEEAKYQIAIRRPTNILYWMHKYGLSEEEAQIKKNEHQSKGGKGSAARPLEEIRKSSPRCKEYYIEKGASEEEALIKVSEAQSLFSLEKCIEKHGVVPGYAIWQDRQTKWQSTLNNKPTDEKLEINKKKNCKKLSTWTRKYGDEEGRVRFIRHLEKISNRKPPETLDDVRQYVLEKLNIDPLCVYLPVNRIRKAIPKYFWELVDKPADLDAWLCSFIDFRAPYGNLIYVKRTPERPNGLYQMHVGDKILRSSREIIFYQLLREHGMEQGIDFDIERTYTNCKMRCDFYLIRGGIPIEIVGGDMSSPNTEYEQKMLYKQDTFGAVLLRDPRDYAKYITEYRKEFYCDCG